MSPSAIATFENNESVTTTLTSIYEKIIYADGNGAKTPKQMIGDALKEKVENIDHELCEPGDEDTFFVADLGEVYRQHMRWKKNLPRVKPFYGKTKFHCWCKHN
jgi:ornithine decarboxylase